MGLQLTIDGIMNTQTRSAIRGFQERRGLRIDGLAGPETERALVDACKTASPSTSSAQSVGSGPAAAAQPGELPWAPEAEWESETVSRRRRRPSSRPAVSSAAAVDRWVLPEEVRAAGEAQHVRYDSPGAWADGRNCSGSYTPGAQELRQYILTHFPGVSTIGGYACRQNTANKAETSVHGVGRALDIMIPRVGGRANSAIGDPIANWLVRNATAIGVQYLIWNRVSWNGHIKAPKDRPYTGPNPHTDHIHVELNQDGAGRKIPWFQRSPNGKPVPPITPGTGSAPRLLKQESTPPGTTLYVSIDLSIVDKFAIAAAPVTGIFIPEGYVPGASVDVILYLHGHKGEQLRRQAIDQYWNSQRFPYGAFREGINASKRNVILVAPTLGSHSEAERLIRSGGLDAYLDQVLAAMRAYGPHSRGGPTPGLGNLILACHSGGGKPMRQLAAGQDRALTRLRECWGFDCTYNAAGGFFKEGDDAFWANWARKRPDAKVYIYYIPKSLYPKSGTATLAESLRDKRVPNAIVKPSRDGRHNYVPITHW